MRLLVCVCLCVSDAGCLCMCICDALHLCYRDLGYVSVSIRCSVRVGFWVIKCLLLLQVCEYLCIAVSVWAYLSVV